MAAIAAMPTDVRPKYIVRRYIFCHSRSVSSGFSPTRSCAQATGDIVAERRIDNRLDDLGRGVGLANALEPVVGANAHQHGVLAAGRFGLRHFRSAGSGKRPAVIFMLGFPMVSRVGSRDHAIAATKCHRGQQGARGGMGLPP